MAGPINHNKNLVNMLKDLYSGETWANRQYKAGKLSRLEIIFYKKEIEDGQKSTNLLKDLGYHENPFMKLLKKP